MTYPGPIIHPPIDVSAAATYRLAMQVLQAAGLPFLVGGAYAYASYTGITRDTKDFDLFIRTADLDAALEALGRDGFSTEVTYPYWLAKAYYEEDMVDLIFRSGNGVSAVDDAWFDRAIQREVLGMDVLLCPPEETIWSKAFIMERERYDGADIAHLLRSCATHLDWPHLLDRFGPYWRVLLSHLVLFGFIYPAERDHVPAFVMDDLLERLRAEVQSPAPADPVCQGTLISREQYLTDIADWNYADARLHPRGNMTADDIDHWTAAIRNGRV